MKRIIAVFMVIFICLGMLAGTAAGSGAPSGEAPAQGDAAAEEGAELAPGAAEPEEPADEGASGADNLAVEEQATAMDPDHEEAAALDGDEDESGGIHEAEMFGECGAGGSLHWEIADDVLTITGKGEMLDEERPWMAYTDYFHRIVIGKGVTSIGAFAFNGCDTIFSVEIGSNVRTIGESAFEGVSQGGFYIDNSEEGRGEPRPLELTVQFGAGLESIGKCAFKFSGLKRAALPAKLRVIGEQAFYNIPLSEVVFGDGITTIGKEAFYACQLTAVSIPDSIEEIGDYAFNYNKSLEEARIGSGIRTIGYRAFGACDKLEKLYIYSADCDIAYSTGTDETGHGYTLGVPGVTTVYSYSGSTAHEQVLVNGHYIFSFCELDTGLTHDAEACGACGEDSRLWWSLEDGVLRVTGTGAMLDEEKPWNEYRSRITAIEIGDGVTYIGAFAFQDLENLERVSIGSGVETIGIKAFEHSGMTEVTFGANIREIRYCAFNDCSALARVDLPGSLETIGPDAFCGCYGLTELTLRDGIKSIGVGSYGSGVFEWAQIRELVIPGSVEEIGELAFCNLPQLTKVTVSSGAGSIGERAFCYDEALETVIIEDDIGELCPLAFSECNALTSIYFYGKNCVIGTDQTGDHREGFTLGVPGKTTIYGYIPSTAHEAAQNGGYYTYTFVDLESGQVHPAEKRGLCGENGCLTWSIADGVLSITGDGAMIDDETPWAAYRDEITAVTVGDGVTYIGEYAFSHLEQMKSLVVGDGVTEIGYGVCGGSPVTELKLGASVETIGGWAFAGCPIDKIELPAGVRCVKESAFALTNTKELILNEGLETIEAYAFHDVGGESVTVPASVETIGYGAFYGIRAKSATVLDGVGSIGANAFSSSYLQALYILDRDCVIEMNDAGSRGNTLGKPGTTTVYGYPGSTAQAAARDTDGRYIYRFGELLGGTADNELISRSELELDTGLAKLGFGSIDEFLRYLRGLLFDDAEHSPADMEAYDFLLHLSEDGGNTWFRVEEDEFTGEDITVLIPYPEGTNRDDFDFSVVHVFMNDDAGHRSGEYERLIVQEGPDGLMITVKSLSPIALAWEKAAPPCPCTAADAAGVLQAVQGGRSADELPAEADMDGDSGFSELDAAQLLRWIVGLTSRQAENTAP